MTIPEENIIGKIQAWRDSLIDLTKRNPLLALPVSVVRLEASPDDLWKLPAKGKRGALRLAPAPVTTTSPAENPSDSLAPDATEDVHRDAVNEIGPVKRRTKSDPLLFPPETIKRLNALRLKSALSLREQGINTLFVTLGTLEWRDPKMGEIIRSPIILLPVEIDRLLDSTGFALSRFEDDIVVNPTLKYRLEQPDVAFDLPDWDSAPTTRPIDPDDPNAADDDDDRTPSTYLHHLTELIAGRRGWTVFEDECLLGRFSYLRLAMYEDLSRQAEVARTRPLIRALAGDVSALAQLPHVDVPAALELDSIPPDRSFHVLSSDPSQEQAVLAARLGQSFVLQGPPGTGKSQTIANIIAACIADGRRVLFVSEKMAALESVFKRLQARGLADFCLEAHSHKANKREILEQLRTALRAQVRTGVSPPDFPLLASLRSDLNAHVRALHATRQPLGRSIYDVRAQVAALEDAADLPFVFTDPDRLSAADIHRCETIAEQISGYRDLFATANTNPWQSLQDTSYSTELQSRVRTGLDDLLRLADSAPVELKALLHATGLPPVDEDNCSQKDADLAVRVAMMIEQSPRPTRAWLEASSEEVVELLTEAAATRSRFVQYQADRADLLEVWYPTVFTLDHQKIADSLAADSETTLGSAFGPDWRHWTDTRFEEVGHGLVRLQKASHNLLASTARLCAVCGLPSAETAAQAKTAVDIAGLAVSAVNPRPGWFALGAINILKSLVRDARRRHDIIDEVGAALDRVYSGTHLAALDIEVLQRRFANDYAGVAKYCIPAYYHDKKSLTGALQPKASLSGRNIVTDLRQARNRREAEDWLEDHATELMSAFGVHYHGGATNWKKLIDALDQTDALCIAFGGAAEVPQMLIDRMILAGAKIGEVTDQYALVARQFVEFEGALGQANELAIALPESGSTPTAQLSLARIEDWIAYEIRPSIANYLYARNAAAAACKTTLTPAEMATDLRTAAHVVAEERDIDAGSDRLRERFADSFAGLSTDWEAVIGALTWTSFLHEVISASGADISPETITLASGADRRSLLTLNNCRTRMELTLDESRRIWTELRTLFRPEALRSQDDATTLELAAYGEQRDFAEEHIVALGTLERWLGLQRLRQESAAAGMLSFYEVTVRSNPAPANIVRAFQRGFYRRWLDLVTASAPEIAAFSAIVHEGRRARLADMEGLLRQSNSGRIRAQARERRDLTGRADVGEVGALKRLLAMKKPRSSVRRMLAEIPNLLGRLTPCLLMSPLSVSLFLDPDRVRFDLVIFDEASQVFVESALGALLRSDQAVIAGDIKQLPPTSFFKGLLDEDNDSDEGAATSESFMASANEFDSVLAAASAMVGDPACFPERELTWHYRSRHESLIAFSRRNFYTHLETFPSASRPSALRFEHVPEGRYLGGAGRPRNNPIEAARVVDLVTAQLRDEPDLSVGVITMSEAQQNAVLAEIDRRRVTEPDLTPLLGEDSTDDRPEPLFVKNIENVQGDERDVIFISIGYGRYPDGRMYQRFGPIGASGGERRVNVAVTRARSRCTVVSSILPSDIVVREDTRPGVRRLREYLEETRRAASYATETDAEERDPDLLIDTVAAELEKRGHAVTRHVGLFDYRVDIAIADPDDSSRYLLGIECDGPVYASGPTAASREALRSEVLRKLGWRLLRVWSADWMSDPAMVVDRIEKAIDRAREGGRPEATMAVVSDPVISVELSDSQGPGIEVLNEAPISNPSPPSAATNGTEARPAGSSLLPGMSYYSPMKVTRLPGGVETLYGDSPECDEARLAFVEAAVSAEGPVALDAVAGLMARSAGLNRAGRRVTDIVQQAVASLVSDTLVEIRAEDDDSYLWPAGLATAPARIPRPDETPRPIEMVSRAEIGEVILAMLRSAIGVRHSEAVQETARLLGYDRIGGNVRGKIEAALADLECDDRIQVRGGQIFIPDIP